MTTALTTRYVNPTCADFISDLSNVWKNYYELKEGYIVPIQSRYTASQTNVYQVVNTARN